MNETNNHQEAEVLSFIDNLNKLKEQEQVVSQRNASKEMKLRKINSEAEKGRSYCIDSILGKIYKDALPFEDPQRNCSNDTARCTMHDFIAKRCDGKNTEYYVREALKKTGSPTLKTMMDGVNNIVREFCLESSKNIGTIKIEDLNFNVNKYDDQLNRIAKNMDADEISDIIQNNVAKTINDESLRAENEEKYRQSIEDKLTKDETVTDDASMEAAIEKMVPMYKQPKVYQPSLFEAITVGKANMMKESAMDEVLQESVREFTKLNVVKALALEKFDLTKVKDMAYHYLKD